MKHNIDLFSLLFMLVISSACIVSCIRFADSKKTIRIRAIVIIVAMLIFILVIAINLIPIPGNGNEIVYITDTGVRYHRENCGSLFFSSSSVSLEKAVELGYTPCHNCSPPEYLSKTIYPKFSDLFDCQTLDIAVLSLLCISVYVLIFFILPSLIARHIKRNKLKNSK